LLDWSQERCPWQLASTFRLVPSQTLSAPISRVKRASLKKTRSLKKKEELARIYANRGLELGLAREVAEQLMAKDALGAHVRDELGISEISTARPVQAALASAATFSAGAAAPHSHFPSVWLIPAVAVGSLVFLALLGVMGARAGGAAITRPIIRVVFWGGLAMGLTAGIGAMVGRAV
jgi:VIT1/CCC1 family predicted Fe2+/Mn2+ transporter